MSHLQEVADILADPEPSPQQLLALAERRHLPLRMFTVTASDLVAGSLTAGYWWWTGVDPQATLLCSQPDLFSYLRQREARTIHGIPWSTAQLGLLQAMLCKHREWRITRLRTLLMRYLWDYLPHARTFAKNGNPIPACPICDTDRDDLHHILVECQHPRMLEARRSILAEAYAGFRANPYLPRPALTYALNLIQLLQIPDATRLSHAIWLGRPFLATLEAADELMPRKSYPSSTLAHIHHHLPTLLLALFEGAILLWKLRCKLLHQPAPTPLAVVPQSRWHLLRRQQLSRLAPTPSQAGSTLSSLPTPSSQRSTEDPFPSPADTLFSPVPYSPTDTAESPSVMPEPLPIAPAYNTPVCTTTYMPVLLRPLSPHIPMRSTILEAVAAQPPPGADNSPPSSIK